ncbi:MAG: crossover junction endodeoxyribonuclease RuvC [Chlorobiaceae bacterium]|nr:crossover junction endodeoxyribonuclease RuvC [Chlorobiaceae bacterium]MBA4309489.1 crossover junction endodeoxyribonuclease RuvC [Chlorobiaceae bacterium]
MIILGIDPGTIKTGYGIIKYENDFLTSINFGTISIPSKKNIPQKLEIIYDNISALIKKYRPDQYAIETAFYGKNVQSTLKIGYARGVSILAAVHNGLEVNEYSPREIKKSVVGSGAASKEQVNFMIKTLLNLKKEKIKLDESDALAVAICHCFKAKVPLRKAKSWKSFIEMFPEKVIN